MSTYISLTRKFTVMTDSWRRENFYHQCCNWLNNNSGPDTWRPDRNSVNGSANGFYIANEADALMFKMKFGL